MIEFAKNMSRGLRAFLFQLSRRQRITLASVFLALFGLPILAFAYLKDFKVDIGLVQVEIYWRPMPLWLAFLVWLFVAGLVFALWWTRRKQH